MGNYGQIFWKIVSKTSDKLVLFLGQEGLKHPNLRENICKFLGGQAK